jgi:hypothetical protein
VIREGLKPPAQAINCEEEGVDVVLKSVRKQIKELAEDEP